MKNYFISTKYNRGMTLVELMVVLSIFVIISGLVIFNYGGFRYSASVQNLANDIALSIRQTQSYAIGSKKLYPTDNPIVPVTAYGISFKASNGSVGAGWPSQTIFDLFADLSLNDRYDELTGVCGPNNLKTGDECLTSFSINGGALITGLTYYAQSNSTGTPVDTLDVVFKRPLPDARICSDSTCSSYGTYAVITVSSLDGKFTKQVKVWNTGQISVQ